MDKKEFKKITKEVYEQYGFVKKGNLFYLDLDEVLLCSGVFSRNGGRHLSYNFSIKAIHSSDEYQYNDMFEGFDSYEIKMRYQESPNRWGGYNILYEEISAEEYRENLLKMLPRFFDPYKQNALDYVLRTHTEIGLVTPCDILELKAKAKQYFGLMK